MDSGKFSGNIEIVFNLLRIFSDNIISSYFSEAISLAKKGRGAVSPNPEVGCVIVQNGEIIGRGFHEEFGKAHAEVNAIANAENAGFSVEGATVFVSLEPCSHCSPHKKTPPCTNLLITKKVSQVYILHQDPNPEVSGNGGEKLQQAGISVFFASEKFPEIFSEYQNFYEKFTYWITQLPEEKIPYVTLKLARSQNNFLGKKDEETKISGKKCREYTLSQRDTHQAILVGANTVLVDNPTLAGETTNPMRIILDSRNIFVGKNDILVKKYQDLNVFRDQNFLIISGRKSVPEILDELSRKNISSVFVEGGGKTAQKFLESGTVNRYIEYTAQNFLDVSAHQGVPGIEISEFPEMQCREKFFLGDDEVRVFEKNTL